MVEQVESDAANGGAWHESGMEQVESYGTIVSDQSPFVQDIFGSAIYSETTQTPNPKAVVTDGFRSDLRVFGRRDERRLSTFLGGAKSHGF